MAKQLGPIKKTRKRLVTDSKAHAGDSVRRKTLSVLEQFNKNISLRACQNEIIFLLAMPVVSF